MKDSAQKLENKNIFFHIKHNEIVDLHHREVL